MATPRDDYDATVRAVADLVRAVEAELGETGTVGMGMPGAISPATGLVKNANSTWLIGRPLDRDLRAALEREVRWANDANCFALSEATDGAAAGARVVFGVIATVTNLLDPDVIVLGGGMSNVRGLYENVPRLWERWAFSDRLDTRLVPPLHGDSSGVRGAAWLWGR